MNPIILNIAVFPPIDYMALVLFLPNVKLEAHEHYQKQTYRNRYYIMGPNGKQFLQVAINKGGNQHCLIKDVEIANDPGWRKKHLRSLDAAYNKSPWYLFYKDQIVALIHLPHATIWELGMSTIQTCAKLLNKPVTLDITDEYIDQKLSSFDLRDTFHPKRGQSLWPAETDEMVYQQVFAQKHGFMPNLSILDLLFNEGPAALSYLKQRYMRLIPYLLEN